MYRSYIYLLLVLFLYQVLCANEGAKWMESDLDSLTEAADSGDAYAQGFLALCHLHGDKKLPVSYLEARFYAENSASRGHWLGNFVLGYLSRYKPIGPNPSLVAKNLLKSFRDPDGHLIKQAALGDPIAAYVLAEIFISEELQTILPPDIKMSAEYYEVSAQSGYGPACVQAALIKIHGLSDSLNGNDTVFLKKGIALLKKGVDMKLPAAHHYLGRCFFEGLGVVEDKELALVHFLAAADRGYGASLVMVADFYAHGLTAAPQIELAFEYIQRAVDIQHEGAEEKRKEYESILGNQTAPPEDLAAIPSPPPLPPHSNDGMLAPVVSPKTALDPRPKEILLPSVYSREDKNPTTIVGQSSEEDQAILLPQQSTVKVAQSINDSVVQIREAAKKAYWSVQGTSSMKDAFNSFFKCAELGDAESARYLGIMYLRGKGTAKDPKLALKWLEVAAGKGDELAKKNLVSLRKIMKM